MAGWRFGENSVHKTICYPVYGASASNFGHENHLINLFMLIPNDH